MTMPSLGHNNSFQDTLESDIRSLKLAQKPSSPCLLHEIASVQGFRGGARQGPGGYMLNGEDTERGIDTMEWTCLVRGIRKEYSSPFQGSELIAMPHGL